MGKTEGKLFWKKETWKTKRRWVGIIKIRVRRHIMTVGYVGTGSELRPVVSLHTSDVGRNPLSVTTVLLR
jgi:hypothetical protein